MFFYTLKQALMRLVILFTLVLISCHNQKKELIEKQIKIKNFINEQQSSYDSLVSFHDNPFYDTATYVKRLLIRDFIKASLKMLRYEFDSLEMESKNY